MNMYRYRDVIYAAPLDEYGYPQHESTLRIVLDKFPIIKKTKCGVWIIGYEGQNKFINTKAKKQFACLTKEEALISFKKRKTRQGMILSGQLERAKEALFLAMDERKFPS